MKDSRNFLYLTVVKDGQGRTGCLDYLIDMLEHDTLKITVLDGMKIKGLKFMFTLGYGKLSISFNKETHNSQNIS